MNTQETPEAAWIGHIADSILEQGTSAHVSGTSQRGIYLQTSALTLFLTARTSRGPLTINIPPWGKLIESVKADDTVHHDGAGITFKDSQVKIDLQQALIWNPGPPPEHRPLTGDQILEIYARVSRLAGGHPYLPFLDTVKQIVNQTAPSSPPGSREVGCIQNAIAETGRDLNTRLVQKLLGAGPGLTPLGDDFLLGIILALRRGKLETSWADGDDSWLVHTARERTTSLSYSLIRCALQGTAEERIIQVVDGLIAGRKIPDREIIDLLSWGSSSGMGVLAGILFALGKRD